MSELEEFGILLTAELTPEKIAAVLRAGPTKAFCEGLAEMLDRQRLNMPYRLGVVRSSKGRPKLAAGGMSDLGEAMVDEVVGLKRGEAKAKKAEIAERFRVSLRTAEEAARSEREVRRLWVLVSSAAESAE